MVSEPVQQCASQAFRAEGFRPFFERQMACDERRAAFVCRAYHINQRTSYTTVYPPTFTLS